MSGEFYMTVVGPLYMLAAGLGIYATGRAVIWWSDRRSAARAAAAMGPRRIDG